MPPVLQLQIFPGKGDGGWKKVSLHHFLADQKIVSLWKKCILGHPVRRFREAGLHEWMPFVIFKSWEVATSFLGRFLSSCCFMLCITMEVEPRIAKQYKCHHCCSCKNYQGKGMEGGKKVSLHWFLADQKIASLGKNCVLGHPVARATSYYLLPDTF